MVQWLKYHVRQGPAVSHGALKNGQEGLSDKPQKNDQHMK
jgi:hypothetical protein